MSDLRLNQKVISRKQHPCGGKSWTVVRVGVEYKFRCDTCGRIVAMLPEKADKFIKSAARDQLDQRDQKD